MSRILGILAAVLMVVSTSHAQGGSLPDDVLNAYEAYGTAVAQSDWDAAVDAALAATEAGERHAIDAASMAVLWENLGNAYMRSDKRLEEADQPDLSFERALALHVSSGDEASAFRLRFRLIQAALADNDGMLAFERMDTFEAAIAESPVGSPDLERQVLAARLSGSRPPSLYGVPSISAEDRARVMRLLELASSGSPDYAIAQTRLIYDAVARQAWDEAETLIFDTTRAVSALSPDDVTAPEDFLSLYSHVLADGYNDVETSGAARWPSDLSQIWCRYLEGRAIVTVRTPPRYPAAGLSASQEGSVTLVYSINAFGELEGIISSERIGRTHRGFVRAAEEALQDWQWRPQCAPQRGVSIEDRTTISFELHH
tara:strand:- start:314 stop:1429 length:1116 start_codon:yes stop_codon:yes gene_type:complete